MTPPPSLSVVVITLAGGGLLEKTLGALALQEPPRPEEIVVVIDPAGEGGQAGRLEDLRRRFPAVHFVVERGNVPRRRARGVRESQSDVIALLEDSCVPAPGWARALVAAHARGEAIVGGPVTPAPGLSIADVAAFLSEFGAHLARPRVGPSVAPRSDAPDLVPRAQLPGCNLSYRRALLAENEALWADGLYESFVNAQMARRGTSILLADDARVLYGARTPYGRALRERFHHGRTYGGNRARGRPVLGLARAAAAPLLVPLFAVRTIRSLIAAREEGTRLADAFPATIPLFAAWAAGEALGSLAGPGRSAEAWS